MQGKTVLITGASTGIGRACALDLASKGFSVFAAVRKEADGESLRQAAAGDLQPLILDVTKADQIEQAKQAVGGELWGLINNAGIAINGPSEFLPLDEYRRQFEVNFFGQIAVTQAFMPAIRQKTGRIVFVGSAGGWVCVPFQGPYSGSKFALEALSDALRQELAPWGIHVSLVKPGAVATPIWETSRGQTIGALSDAPEATLKLYGEALAKLGAAALVTGGRGIPAARIASAVHHALTARTPRSRYLVGREAALARIARFLPDRLRDALIAWQLEQLVNSAAGRAARQEIQAAIGN